MAQNCCRLKEKDESTNDYYHKTHELICRLQMASGRARRQDDHLPMDYLQSLSGTFLCSRETSIVHPAAVLYSSRISVECSSQGSSQAECTGRHLAWQFILTSVKMLPSSSSARYAMCQICCWDLHIVEAGLLTIYMCDTVWGRGVTLPGPWCLSDLRKGSIISCSTKKIKVIDSSSGLCQSRLLHFTRGLQA